jgi:redox-sensitive bicupin YhaK (pirin superfamily)
MTKAIKGNSTIERRPSQDRGHSNHGWLDTYHSFSFADYYNPGNTQFGPLRVLNEDFIKAGEGFGTHPHRDMEIVTYVLSGALAHKDSAGGEGVIRAGEVQRMTAGSGIRHSEFNASQTKDVHLLQVWFLPEKENLTPGYEQKELKLDTNNKIVPVVSYKPVNGSLRIHQDVTFYVCNLGQGKTVSADIKKGRLGYMHNTMTGRLQVNDITLEPGDGLKITGPENLDIRALLDSKFVLFDMSPLD